MKFIEEALQEMKEIEESKVTQRFNKCCCLKDWRNKRRYSTLQPRSWQEGTRDPEGHQRATLMVKKKNRGHKTGSGIMEIMQSFGLIWSYDIHWDHGGKGFLKKGGTEWDKGGRYKELSQLSLNLHPILPFG